MMNKHYVEIREFNTDACMKQLGPFATERLAEQVRRQEGSKLSPLPFYAEVVSDQDAGFKIHTPDS